MTFDTMWMDVEGIMLNETNQTGKDKYPIIPLISNLE